MSQNRKLTNFLQFNSLPEPPPYQPISRPFPTQSTSTPLPNQYNTRLFNFDTNTSRLHNVKDFITDGIKNIQSLSSSSTTSPPEPHTISIESTFNHTPSSSDESLDRISHTLQSLIEEAEASLDPKHNSSPDPPFTPVIIHHHHHYDLSQEEEKPKDRRGLTVLVLIGLAAYYSIQPSDRYSHLFLVLVLVLSIYRKRYRFPIMNGMDRYMIRIMISKGTPPLVGFIHRLNILYNTRFFFLKY